MTFVIAWPRRPGDNRETVDGGTVLRQIGDGVGPLTAGENRFVLENTGASPTGSRPRSGPTPREWPPPPAWSAATVWPRCVRERA